MCDWGGGPYGSGYYPDPAKDVKPPKTVELEQPIKLRTESERISYLQGFQAGLDLVKKLGIEDAQQILEDIR